MENQLYTYSVTFPLRYYAYAINSEQRDSEYVMGLKQDIYWDVERLVEEQIPDTKQLFRQMEPVHFHLFCEKDSENEKMPADFFSIKITNIVVHGKDQASSFIKPYLYKICRTLSFFLSRHNCNKHNYQPRVEADVENAAWEQSVYVPFDQLLHRDKDATDVETTWIDGKKYQVITMETAPIVVSASLYTKIFGNMPVDDFLKYTDCTDTDINFMLDEFYLALGQENRYSKFFHLFSIIEFVEKRYKDINGANKLIEPDKREDIMNSVLDILGAADKEKIKRVKDPLNQMLGELTDIGRKEKLVNILHAMGIYKIENCATEFEIDVGMIGPIIKMRNEFYHGDRKMKDKSDSDIDLAVTRLMYICEQIIVFQMNHLSVE